MPIKIEHFRLGFLILKLHLVSANFDNLALGGIRGVAGNDEKSDKRPLLAADFLHDLVELHIHDILEFSVPLRHGSDRGR